MIYTITIFFHLFLCSTTTNDSTDVHLSFGRRVGCIGSGICAIEQPDSYRKSTYDALGTIEVIQNNIVLKIDKTSISVADAQNQFKENTFIMKEQLPLSEKLCNSIGVDQHRNIATGTYSVIESENTYQITFLK